MMRLALVLTTILGVGFMAPAHVVAQDDATGVTGAAEATLPRGATFNGVALSGLTVGQGIFVARDGSATGNFQAVLRGISLLGTPQSVTVEGEIQNGFVRADGTASFNGTATVEMGDGTLPLLEVPITVTASTGSLGLILGATELPTATLTAGSITIE